MKTWHEYLDPDHEFTLTLNNEVIHHSISESQLLNGTSIQQTIEFAKTKHYGTILLMDGMVQTCDVPELEAPYHETLIHTAIHEHGNAKRIIILGGGDGAAVREVLKHDQIEECLVVEIDAQVVELSKKYIPYCAQSLASNDPRLKLMIADCNSILDDPNYFEKFDIVISDLTDILDPKQIVVRDSLYNRHFYNRLKKLLAKGGILMTHIGRLIPSDVEINARVIFELRQALPNSRYLSTYVPMFFQEWLFAIASVDANHEWCRLSESTLRSIQQKANSLTVYDKDFHANLFFMNHRLKSLEKILTGLRDYPDQN